MNPDLPYTIAIGGGSEDAHDREFRTRLRAAYASRFAAMDPAAMRALLVDAAEALDSLGSTFSGDPRDWGDYRRDAWAYGIVCGWDGGPGDDPADDAMSEIAQKHGWSEALVDRLRRHAKAIEALTDHPYLWPDVQRERAAEAERELHRQEALALWERRQNGELTEAQYQRKLLDIGKEPDDLTRETT